jgi:protoheme IX farnesyltransferase
MSTLSSYFELTKPRLLPLVLFSALPALVMASGGWPSPRVLLVVLGGTALAAGAANALNSYLEREEDARMERTRTRPLPAGRISPTGALVMGLVLCVLGPGLLWWATGPAAAAVAVAGICFYVFAYTLWLKPRSPIAVAVGGVAGAVAPLIADAAVGGSIGPAGWIVFSIIFVWQLPHFWAITLYRRPEYEAAGFPLMLSRVGEAATRRRILGWSALLVPITLTPVVLSLLGPLYTLCALALNGYFLWAGVRLVREKSDEAARRVFRVSLVYLMGILAAMILDLAIGAGLA